jgi:hypothetical protein
MVLLSVALFVCFGTALALRGAYQSEDPRSRRLAADLGAAPRARGYVFSNYSDEATFLNLNRSRLPGLGLPDAPRLSKRMQLLLEGFKQRVQPAQPAAAWEMLQVAQARPGAPDTSVERWLAERSYPLEPRWYGDVRLNAFLFLASQDEYQIARSVRFGDLLQLEEARWRDPVTLEDQRWLPVSLRWSRLAQLDRAYRVILQLQDAQGTLLAQSDGDPEGGSFPTSLWRRDSRVVDNRLLALPGAGLPPEAQLVLSVSDPNSGAFLPPSGTASGPTPNSALLASPRLQ